MFSTMHTKVVSYSDKQNRVLLVIAFIQKAIAYSCVNKIQICKHGSCSIQCIVNHVKKKLFQIQLVDH
jgi:hypothetical protein